jgi:hypothetical protein
MNDWVPFSAVAIFAEDVREERAGTVSLIGILPDTVVLSAFPAVLPRLNLYIRISYDPNDPPSDVSCGLRINDEPPLLTQDFAAEPLAQAVAETVAGGGRIGTIIARFGAVNLELREACLLNATVTWNGEEFIVGNLMVKSPTI